MVAECWVIIIILGIAAYMFIRRHKKIWAGSVLPLMLVPAVTIIFSPIERKILSFSSDYAYSTRTVLYLLAFAAACVWTVVWGGRLPAGKSRLAYIFVSIAFTFILILIFLYNLVFVPLFK